MLLREQKFSIQRLPALAVAILLVFLNVGLSSCGGARESPVEHGKVRTKPVVFAPNPPLAWIVRELAGDAVEVLTPWMSRGGDPVDWSPRDDEVRQLQEADLIVLNGADYEPWSSRVALPRALILNTTATCGDALIEQDGTEHSHGPRGAHSHKGFASNTWLSPALCATQAQAIAARLSQLLPKDAAPIATRLASLELRLQALHQHLRECADRAPQWLASHPVYQYLAASAGASIDAVHWEPSDTLSAAQWAEFETMRGKISNPTPPMFWEGEPQVEVRARLEALGVIVLVYPPLGRDGMDFVQSCDESLFPLRDSILRSLLRAR